MNEVYEDKYYMDEYSADAYPENDYRTYLQHYGVQGQRWGKRNAEWYPIADWQAHIANTKGQEAAKSFGDKVKAAYKEHKKNSNLRKARRIKAKKAANAKREEVRQVRSEAKKQKILRGGTPGDIIKIRSQLSDQEIADAVARNNNINRLREAENTRLQQISDAEWERKYGKYRKFFDAIKKGASVTSDVANAIDKVNNIVNPKQPKKINPLDVLAHPERFTNDEVKEARDRAENMKNIKNSLSPKKEATFEEILANPEKFTTDEVTAANRKAQAVKNGQNALDELNRRSAEKNASESNASSANNSTSESSTFSDITNKVDKETLNTPMSETKNKTYSYEEALDYWINNQSGKEQTREKAEKILGKYVYESLIPSDSERFASDKVYKEFINNNAKKIDKEAIKDLKRKGIKVDKNSDEYHDAVTYAAERLMWSDRDYQEKYKSATKEDDDVGRPVYSESQKNKMMNNAKTKDSYNIDFLETVQNDSVLGKGGKELQKEYKKFLDDPKKYMETFEESDYSKKYKNSKRVRDIAAKVREDGYASLTDAEKEIFNDAYR